MKKTKIAGAIYSSNLEALLSANTQAEGAQAETTQAGDLHNMVSKAKVNFDFRYQYEFVEQNGFGEDTCTSTLRTRLSYTSATLHGVSLKNY